MTPDEKEIQEKKIRLMKLAMAFGFFISSMLVALLIGILEQLRTISTLLGIVGN